MYIFRSIAAVVVGALVGVVVVGIVEFAGFIVHGPSPEKPFGERRKEMEKMAENAELMKAFLESAPMSAMFLLLVAWCLGAFLGGGVAALIAGRARVVHAGIIGAVILVSTVANYFRMQSHLDYTHPLWLILSGILLPIPTALLGGLIVAMLFPPPPRAPAATP